MKTITMSALIAAGLFTFLAASAMAQETRTVWKTDGKRYWRTEEVVKPAEMPKTQLVEVSEKQPGDVEGFKYVGKHMERAYFREVPVTTETARGHVCSWRMVYEKKQVYKYNVCIVDGVEHACLGMNHAGECLGMK